MPAPHRKPREAPQARSLLSRQARAPPDSQRHCTGIARALHGPCKSHPDSIPAPPLAVRSSRPLGSRRKSARRHGRHSPGYAPPGPPAPLARPSSASHGGKSCNGTGARGDQRRR